MVLHGFPVCDNISFSTDINAPNDSEGCDRISDRTIIIIVCSGIGGLIVLGVVGFLCVCCIVRGWGRVRKLPHLAKYRKQLSDERNRLMADGNVLKDKDKRLEKLDQKIDETDYKIGRLASDSGGEVETDLNAPSGEGQVISKSSSTEEGQEAVEGGGEGVVRVCIEPGQEDKR